MEYLISCFVFVLIYSCILGYGFALFSHFKNIQYCNFWEIIFFSYCIGMSLNVIILILLGFSGLLDVKYFLSVFLIINILACVKYKTIFLFVQKNKYNLSISFFFLCIVCIISYHHAGYWDDTMYHLPMVRFYLENEACNIAYFLRFPLFPQNIDILFCIPGLILGVNSTCFEYFTQMQASSYIIITIFGLLAASKKYTESYIYGCISSAVLFTINPIFNYIGFAYIDSGVILFCFASVLALALYIDDDEDDKFYFIVSAIFSGVAIGSKLFGLVFMCMVGLVYIITNYRKWKNILIYIAITLAVGSWWYIRSWYISGDPVHPAGGPVFGFYLWDAQDLASQIAEQGTHGVTKRIGYLFDALNKADVEFLIFILGIMPIYRSITSGLRLIFTSVLLYVVFWFYVTQVERYILYIVPIALVILSYLIYVSIKNIIPCYCKIANSKVLNIVFCTSLAFFILIETIPQGVKLYNNPPRAGQELFTEANKYITLNKKTIVQVGFEDLVFFYKGICLGDWFGYLKYRNLISENNYIIKPDDMLNVLKRYDAHMLIVNYQRHKLNKEEYSTLFDIILETKNGILMTPKEN